MATFPSPASGGGSREGCGSRAVDLGDRLARFFPRFPNYLQVFETGERRQIYLLPFAQIELP